MTLALLRKTWPDGGFDLAVYVVAEAEMTRLNETFLRHKGSTDVITFDYSENAESASRPPTCPAPNAPSRDRRDACPALLHGEIFICVDEAISQARRFRTTWQSELLRYVVHGVLHLLGYDDHHAPARRTMKKQEDALVDHLSRQFDLCSLGAPQASNQES
jgi:rRNA maturation RNase YbeY